MKNRKYNLLPYETIVKAAAGEPEAVNTVIQTYTGYIKYLSYFQAVRQPRGRKRINRLRPQSMMMCYAIESEKVLHNAALQT